MKRIHKKFMYKIWEIISIYHKFFGIKLMIIPMQNYNIKYIIII
jgi:hypothetical protein